MKKKNIILGQKFDFDSHDEIKNFWRSQIWKLEVKKNICSWLTIILNISMAFLNLATLTLLISAIILIDKKVNSPNFDPNDADLNRIISLVSLSIILSLGIIVASSSLMIIKKKNKYMIYHRICLDLNNLIINGNGEIEDIDSEIKAIIDKHTVLKKEKLFKTLKQFISEDKIKWT
ncbi:MAG: hypothetical protein ACRDCJ_00475 [Metamycoplasmataceae bacterium]